MKYKYINRRYTVFGTETTMDTSATSGTFDKDLRIVMLLSWLTLFAIVNNDDIVANAIRYTELLRTTEPMKGLTPGGLPRKERYNSSASEYWMYIVESLIRNLDETEDVWTSQVHELEFSLAWILFVMVSQQDLTDNDDEKTQMVLQRIARP